MNSITSPLRPVLSYTSSHFFVQEHVCKRGGEKLITIDSIVLADYVENEGTLFILLLLYRVATTYKYTVTKAANQVAKTRTT